jgi:hypothetical protein
LCLFCRLLLKQAKCSLRLYDETVKLWDVTSKSLTMKAARVL